MKCAICGKEIEEAFLEKIKGTIVKIKVGEKNAEHYVCDGCQKKYREKLKEKLEKSL
ncbi:MAG: hypothetical protein KKE23_00130 [Nanoarchaeota archaeon]|nr:hypothetical protein [Nanoarchaeota archaeon]